LEDEQSARIGLYNAIGVGVFGQNQEEDYSIRYWFNHQSILVSSALQAEAKSMVFATRIVSMLNLQWHTFLTDNGVFPIATSKFVALQLVPWEFRNHIVEFSNLSRSSAPAVYHIKKLTEKLTTVLIGILDKVYLNLCIVALVHLIEIYIVNTCYKLPTNIMKIWHLRRLTLFS
jgi:hypothetical protein